MKEETKLHIVSIFNRIIFDSIRFRLIYDFHFVTYSSCVILQHGKKCSFFSEKLIICVNFSKAIQSEWRKKKKEIWWKLPSNARKRKYTYHWPVENHLGTMKNDPNKNSFKFTLILSGKMEKRYNARAKWNLKFVKNLQIHSIWCEFWKKEKKKTA